MTFLMLIHQSVMHGCTDDERTVRRFGAPSSKSGGGYEGCWLDYTLGVNITLLGFSVMSLAISSTVPYSMMPAWQ